MAHDPTPDAVNLVDQALKAQGKTRADLGRDLNISRQQISRTLNTVALINPRSEHWLPILDALGLEIIVRAKAPAGAES